MIMIARNRDGMDFLSRQTLQTGFQGAIRFEVTIAVIDDVARQQKGVNPRT